MTKSRKENYKKEHDLGITALLSKFGVFAAIIGGLYYAFTQFGGDPNSNSGHSNSRNEHMGNADHSHEKGYDHAYLMEQDFFPAVKNGTLIKHKYLALSYVEKHEQAEWVAYELTKDRLRQPKVKRMSFKPDNDVKTGSATPYDDYKYARDNYTKGHLAPASDMGFSNASMKETFLMSNISPQTKNFNGGIWRELEEQTRDWAEEFDHLYIVTGPVLNDNLKKTIGPNDVTVPEDFYKVILDLTEPKVKGIGFVIPHKKSYEKLDYYARSIDEVEKITGLNFFPDLMDADVENEIESTYNPGAWNYDNRRFEKRLKQWNTQE